MKALRYALWGLVVLVAGALAYVTFMPSPRAPSTQVAETYGAPFIATLVADGRQRPMSREDMLGRPHVMFFGFTHCPDVCPTTLFEASQWLAQLGDAADGLDIYFITIDPLRDDAETLQDYVSAFDPRIKAVTGSEEEIATLVAGWNVYTRKVSLEDGDYTMDHTASTFLMRSDGSLQGTIAYRETTETALAKLRRLLGD